MRLPEMLMRVFPMAALSIAVCSTFGADESPAQQKLKADLILHPYPIHVGQAEQEADLLGYVGSYVTKITVAPRVKCSSTILREPVYDVSGFLKPHGLELPAGSRALYSSNTGLLFLELTDSDRTLADSLLAVAGIEGFPLLSVDVLVTLKSPIKTETLLDVKTVPFVSGQRLEFMAKGERRVRVAFEPVIGPDGETIDVDLDVDIQTHGGSLHKEIKKPMRASKGEKEELGTLVEADVTLQIQTHFERDYFGPPVLETPEKKAAALAEIQKALRSTPTR